MAKRWADEPFALINSTGILSRPDIPPDHGAVRLAQMMSLAHNALLRSLNASFNQCLAVQPGTTEARDFLFFNQSLVEVLKFHHDIEDEFMFTAIEQLTEVPGIMDQNIQEHKEFLSGMEAFQKYVSETSADAYDGQTFQRLLEGFGKSVEKHLHNEIPTLIALKDYDSSKMKKIAADLGKRSSNVDKFRCEARIFS
jgi:hemerythrin-like domain-containing protein